MAEGQDQNRSEAPTPFKLQKARERGSVARSLEVGFLAMLIALAGFVLAAGERSAHTLAQAMRIGLSGGIARATEPDRAAALAGDVLHAAVAPLSLLGGTMVAVVILLELVQLRGFIFTTHPLKPDFSRLNPAKGLKRMLSMRMPREALKALFKTAAYAAATWLTLRYAYDRFALTVVDGERLVEALSAVALRLILSFLGLAVFFAILDQILVRREFTKQMRMSRREVTKEHKDREGEPRIKRRRKQLHGELVAQGKGLGAVAGSDLLVVNPEHFAVALTYDDTRMIAPEVSTKGRNAHALLLKAEAHRHGVPVVADPPLARALYRTCAIGATIPPDRFEAVAELYIQHRRPTPQDPTRP